MSLLRRLLRPIDLLLVYLAIRGAPQQQVLGFRLACSNVRTNSDTFFQLCKAALGLLRTFDPRRFECLRRDVRTIALTGRGVSYYDPRLRTIFLDVDVLKREPEYVATTIAHEAVHARLYWASIRTYSTHAGRHERLCVAQELDFAARLPNSAALVEEIRGSLDHPWWNESGRREQIRRFAQRYNLPQWLERFLVRFGASDGARRPGR